MFWGHQILTYEKIESISQHVQRWKSLMQEFGVTLLYIKVEANVFSNYFRQITMAHHAHKLADTTLEEDNCKIMCPESLYISDNTDCFSLDIEDISFLLAPQIAESKHNLEHQQDSIINIRTNINKYSSNWK